MPQCNIRTCYIVFAFNALDTYLIFSLLNDLCVKSYTSIYFHVVLSCSFMIIVYDKITCIILYLQSISVTCIPYIYWANTECSHKVHFFKLRCRQIQWIKSSLENKQVFIVHPMVYYKREMIGSSVSHILHVIITICF